VPGAVGETGAEEEVDAAAVGGGVGGEVACFVERDEGRRGGIGIALQVGGLRPAAVGPLRREEVGRGGLGRCFIVSEIRQGAEAEDAVFGVVRLRRGEPVERRAAPGGDRVRLRVRSEGLQAAEGDVGGGAVAALGRRAAGASGAPAAEVGLIRDEIVRDRGGRLSRFASAGFQGPERPPGGVDLAALAAAFGVAVAAAVEVGGGVVELGGEVRVVDQEPAVAGLDEGEDGQRLVVAGEALPLAAVLGGAGFDQREGLCDRGADARRGGLGRFDRGSGSEGFAAEQTGDARDQDAEVSRERRLHGAVPLRHGTRDCSEARVPFVACHGRRP